MIIHAGVTAACHTRSTLVYIQTCLPVLMKCESGRTGTLGTGRSILALPVATTVVNATRCYAMSSVSVEHVLNVATTDCTICSVGALMLAATVSNGTGCQASAFVGVKKVTRATGTGHASCTRALCVILTMMITS